jgi:phage shock protein C
MTQLESPTAPTSAARVRRSKTDRVVAGVCGGLGSYFGVDPLWFRLAFVVLAVGGGAGVLLYIIGWVVIPEAGNEEGRASQVNLGNKGPMIAGISLVVIGLLFMANIVAPWFNRFMWPAVLIAVGLAVLYTGGRHANT